MTAPRFASLVELRELTFDMGPVSHRTRESMERWLNEYAPQRWTEGIPDALRREFEADHDRSTDRLNAGLGAAMKHYRAETLAEAIDVLVGEGVDVEVLRQQIAELQEAARKDEQRARGAYVPRSERV